MKHTTSQLLKVIFGLVAFIALIGLAGSLEHNEEIVYNMSQEAYDAVVEKLGDNATQKEIAREYTDNKTYYDTLY